MATSDDLDALRERAPGADFVALLRLLERQDPDAAEVGRAGPPADERIRLHHDPSLAFNPGDIRSLERDGDRWTLVTTFLGLTGGVSPLPAYLCEEALSDDNAAFSALLDLFHHRLLSLLHRLLAADQLIHTYRSDASDPWSARVLQLAGILPSGHARKTSISRPLWLRLAALRASATRSAHTLTTALREALRDVLDGAEPRVEQFTGGWVDLDRAQQMQLGRCNSHLGPQALLGGRALARASRLRIVIGPLRRGNFRRFLPGGDQLPVIAELIRSFTDAPIEHELELVLPAGRAPKFTLAGRSETAMRSRLGQDTWLLGACARDTHILVPTHRAVTRSQ